MPTDDGRLLRIGLIAPPWLPVPPVAYGGTETVLDVLARGLSERGHSVVLFAATDSSCPVEIRSAGGPGPGVDIGGSPVEVHHALAAYRSLVDVDVIHDHTSMGPLVAWGERRAHVVTTNHNPFSAPYGSVFATVDEVVDVVAISHHHAASAVGVKIAKVIHHGLDPRSFPVGDGSGGHLAFLGRMSPSKGPQRAIAIAKATGMPLILAGKQHSSAEQQFFEAEIRPQLSAEITYIGEVGFKDKIKLLGDAIALVNPIAWDEPFGMVMIESLACGTPVLAYARGAAPEIVSPASTGFLGNSEDDLIALSGRLDEIDRRACRAAIEGHFSVTRMVDEHLELYRRALLSHEATWPR
jgi:glycosyltransferase involved in cell wall biosynthesis